MRTLLVVAVAATIGWVARGKAEAPAVAVAPVRVPTAAPQIVYVAQPQPQREVQPEPEPEPEGEDIGELLEQAKGLTAGEVKREDEPPRNGVYGRAVDKRTGEPLAGVTAIATSNVLPGAQTAISDEHGDYVIRDLPAGSYTVTFYYADVTAELSNITVRSFDSTRVDERLDVDPPLPERSPTLVNIPVPSRTFEAALGAAGSQEDGVGVSFVGVSTLDNVYVVDGVELPQ